MRNFTKENIWMWIKNHFPSTAKRSWTASVLSVTAQSVGQIEGNYMDIKIKAKYTN